MYLSTRGNEKRNASYAIMNGLSKDGGLYTLDSWPKASFLANLEFLTYEEIAFEVLSYFLDDFTSDEIKRVISKAYSKENFPDQIVGLDSLGNNYLLTLFHGPTFAFKDMALSMFSSLQKLAKDKSNEKRKTIILSATSGDTGSAVLSGFKEDNETEVVIFYPNNKVSEFQEKQMHSFTSKNRHVIALEGTFDDCQNLIKRAFTEITPKNTIFSSANSINIARIIPQVIYYFYAYKELVNKNRIQYGDLINFVVPTGNFGNILAGYYAYKMGLYVNQLIVASNENNVLTDFFQKGVYDRRRPFIQTSSPSMDILISSNLERFLFDVLSQDSSKVRQKINELKENGFYHIQMSHPLFSKFSADFMTESESLRVISKTFNHYHLLIDPHTAVGVGVLEKYITQTNDKHVSVVLSTASPVKFINSVFTGLNETSSLSFEKDVLFLKSNYNLFIDPRVLTLKKIEVKRTVWSVEDALLNLEKLVGEIDV